MESKELYDQLFNLFEKLIMDCQQYIDELYELDFLSFSEMDEIEDKREEIQGRIDASLKAKEYTVESVEGFRKEVEVYIKELEEAIRSIREKKEKGGEPVYEGPSLLEIQAYLKEEIEGEFEQAYALFKETPIFFKLEGRLAYLKEELERLKKKEPFDAKSVELLHLGLQDFKTELPEKIKSARKLQKEAEMDDSDYHPDPATYFSNLLAVTWENLLIKVDKYKSKVHAHNKAAHGTLKKELFMLKKDLEKARTSVTTLPNEPGPDRSGFEKRIRELETRIDDFNMVTDKPGELYDQTEALSKKWLKAFEKYPNNRKLREISLELDEVRSRIVNRDEYGHVDGVEGKVKAVADKFEAFYAEFM